MRGVSTFGAFTTARLGIIASQKALEVTGHNITNINTIGYTRQRLDQMSLRVGGADRYASQYDTIVGSGVLCTGVSQLRDPYLDIRFRNEQSSVGAMDTKLSGLEELSNILDEVTKGDEKGVLEAQFNDLRSQLVKLGLSPEKNENDTLVRSSANALVKLLNSYATQLNTIQKNQDISFHQDLDTVNGILKNIADLNDTILKSEIHGDPSLELKDQRNLLIDKLSQYVKINVERSSVGVGAGKTVDTLIIKLAGTTKGDAAKSQATLVNGNYAAQFSIRSGSTNYDLDLSALTNANGTVFTDPNTNVTSTPVQLGDLDLYGSLQAARELLTEAGEFTADGVITGSIDPDAAAKRGIPYYQKVLDSLANKLATTMNEANSGYLVDATGFYVNKTGEKMIGIDDSGNYVDKDGNQVLGSDGNPLTKDTPFADIRKYLDDHNAAKAKFSGDLFSQSDNTTTFTASNISISKSWAVGTTRIVNSNVIGSDGVPNSTDAKNIIHMQALLDEKHSFYAKDVAPGAYEGDKAFFEGSFQEMLANFSGTLANDVKSTTILLNNYSASATELDVNRSAVSSVDLNDEAANLMQYQKSYAAACRLMTTLDEALDKLINGTGVVGR